MGIMVYNPHIDQLETLNRYNLCKLVDHFNNRGLYRSLFLRYPQDISSLDADQYLLMNYTSMHLLPKVHYPE
jgi:ADP-dependent phosphofructokinase/glucokinase